ncbi:MULTISPECIES: hypothetical protein [unclassified Pseudodesulfovibrio]|uniref:hypothetical protein n=1 Tax=unclassified Pseudodesulfovibrio TaxID=2661612 RepID=UPI000FEBD29F|nr:MULTISPECIES: hypothetical protein [unclassified Pseudodesulfovibrio]MCJ2163579.1 hypothetical protein [Pseudodesulfovibrio sp. S3-i]RWU06813.1 hypothetical protein DWB63_03360 [Pseudodesulfovibrio sp. S3]
MNTRCSLCGLATLVLCIVLGVQLAWSQDQSLVDLADRARKCGVFSETVDRVLSSVSSGVLAESDAQSLLSPLLEACETGLPTAPFEDKLEEGLSKSVAPPLVVRALERKLEEYTFARSLLDGRLVAPDPRPLVVLGEGLSKGTPREDVQAYVVDFSSQPPEPFLTGAEMTSLLGQVGFDYDLTRSMLQAGFDSKGLTYEWRFFVRLVLVARQRGLTDEAIAGGAVQVLSANGSLSDVSARLGFTSRSLTGRASSN